MDMNNYEEQVLHIRMKHSEVWNLIAHLEHSTQCLKLRADTEKFILEFKDQLLSMVRTRGDTTKIQQGPQIDSYPFNPNKIDAPERA